jgi:hypothetical protein
MIEFISSLADSSNYTYGYSIHQKLAKRLNTWNSFDVVSLLDTSQKLALERLSMNWTSPCLNVCTCVLLRWILMKFFNILELYAASIPPKKLLNVLLEFELKLESIEYQIWWPSNFKMVSNRIFPRKKKF